MSRGRWMVITGTLVSRHRRLSEARAMARLGRVFRAQIRHWRKRDVVWDDRCGLYFLERE